MRERERDFSHVSTLKWMHVGGGDAKPYFIQNKT